MHIGMLQYFRRKFIVPASFLVDVPNTFGIFLFGVVHGKNKIPPKIKKKLSNFFGILFLPLATQQKKFPNMLGTSTTNEVMEIVILSEKHT